MVINKSVKLFFKIYIYNKEKDIELILLYNKEKKFINNNNYYQLKEDINNLKEEIKILKKEIETIKYNKKIENKEENQIYNSFSINNLSPKDIQYKNDLAKDSFSQYDYDNVFTVFKSLNNLLYLIYTNINKSIIFYDIVDNKNIKEIKSAHYKYT